MRISSVNNYSYQNNVNWGNRNRKQSPAFRQADLDGGSRDSFEREMTAVIMAGGDGIRLQKPGDDRPKVMQTIGDPPLPMLWHVIKAALDTKKVKEKDIYVITGVTSDKVDHTKTNAFVKTYFPLATCITQPRIIKKADDTWKPGGTGHAVSMVAPILNEKGRKVDVLVLSGDMPLFKPGTIEALIKAHTDNPDIDLTLMTADYKGKGPTPEYGRIIYENGKPCRIVEYADATPEQRALTEVNVGMYCINWDKFADAFDLCTPGQKDKKGLNNINIQNEYYLTDLLDWGYRKGCGTQTFKIDDIEETAGANKREELAPIDAILKARKTGVADG